MLNEEISNNQEANSEVQDTHDQNQPEGNKSEVADEKVEDLAQARDENAESTSQNDDGSETQQPDSDSDSQELSELEVENQELKTKNEQILLHMADYENRAKRAEQQVKDVRQYAITGFAKDMLVVADNLGRAIEAITGEPENDTKPTAGALVEGVQMTLKELHNQLSKHGIEQFDPVGEKFDPNFHQAMFEVPNADVPNNTIISVQQKGYSIGDRILRPALVGVSKSSEKDSEVEGNESTTPAQVEDNQNPSEETESSEGDK